MKKNIIILTITSIIFIIALIFSIIVINNYGKNNVNDISVLDEESKTEDITDVSYEDITIYREDNSEVKLSEFENKPVMMLFLSKENEDSIEVLKKVNGLYKNYDDKIIFLMINTDKEVDKNIKKEVSVEIYYDFYEEASKKYNIDKLPSMIYIDKNNQILNAKSGFTTTDALEANLDILSDNI